MPDCEDRQNIAVDMVSSNVAAIAKVDEPFPKLFGKVIDHPTETGLPTEYLQAQSDRLTGPVCSISVLRMQEIPQPLQIPDRRRGFNSCQLN